MSSADARIKQVMAAVFGTGPDEIGDDASHETVEKWDSLSHMNLIMALEDEFGFQFDDQEIIELTSFSAIADAVRGRV